MLGSRNAAGFFAALPLDEQLQFNVLRGPLPGGEQGILFHEVLALPVSPDGRVAGADRVFGYVYSPPGGGLRARHVLANLVPRGDPTADAAAQGPARGLHRDPLHDRSVLVPEVALEEFTLDHGYLRDAAELDELAPRPRARAGAACRGRLPPTGARSTGRSRRPTRAPAPWADPLDAYAWRHGLASRTRSRTTARSLRSPSPAARSASCAASSLPASSGASPGIRRSRSRPTTTAATPSCSRPTSRPRRARACVCPDEPLNYSGRRRHPRRLGAALQGAARRPRRHGCARRAGARATGRTGARRALEGA